LADSPIGEIPILITGDYSELETAIAEAASAAEEGASQIADAFDVPSLGDEAVDAMQAIATAALSLQSNAEAAGQALSDINDGGDLSDIADAAGDAGEALSAIADSAGEAASSVSDVGDAGADLADVSDQADDASASLDDIASSAGEAASSLSEAGEAGADLADVSESADQAATAITDVADSAGEAASSLDDLSSGDLGDISDDLESASDAADDLESASEGAAAALEDVPDSAGDIEDLSDGMESAAAAAGDLESGAEGASEALAEVGESAEEAEGGLSEFAEQLLGVGEALAITEGLKELADEAEEASDKITTASIALTTITGSASQAKEVIEGLEEIGTNEGLAMPSLLTAATRMQQMLGPGVDVTELLSSIGNGAQAMGTDITAAAQKFDQMAVSGTASARTMSTLGISLTSLAAAINEVSGTEAANEQNAAAMFKAMDQSQRIEVLQTAMQGLAGVAQQVAQQTFGAQWTILANQWENVMIQAGQALLPIVTELNDLLKTDVLPFVQELATAFNSLPTPIRDGAVAVVALTAALAAGALAAGALALPLSALGEVLPSVVAVMTTLGIVASTTAAAEGAETEAAIASAAAHGAQAEALGAEAVAAGTAEIATEGVAAEAVAASAGFGAFGLTLGPVALGILGVVAAIAAANFTGVTAQIEQLGTNLKNSADFWEELGSDIKATATEAEDAIGLMTTSFLSLIPGINGANNPLSIFNTAVTALSGYLPSASSQLEAFAERLLGIPIPLQQVNQGLALLGQASQQMTPAIAGMLQGLQATPPAFALANSGVEGFSVGLTTLITKQQQATATVNAAKQTLTEAQEAYAAGAVSINVVQAATVAYDNAVQAAIPHGKDFATTVAGIEQAAAKAQATFQSSLTVYQQLVAGFNDGTVSAAALDEGYTKLEASAKKAGQAIADATGVLAQWQQQGAQAQGTFDAISTALDTITQKFNAGDATINQYVSDYAKWQAAAKAAGEVAVTVEGQVAELTNAAALQVQTLDVNIAAWAQLSQAAKTNADDQAPAAAAMKLVQQEASALGITITQVGNAYQVSAANANPAMQSIVKNLTDWMNQQGLTTSTVTNGLRAITDATTGITSYSDATGAAGEMVQKLVNIQGGGQVAMLSFSDATAKATTAVQQHTQAAQQLDTTVINISSDFGPMIQQIGNSTTAHQGATTAANSHKAALQGLGDQSDTTSGQFVTLNGTIATFINGGSNFDATTEGMAQAVADLEGKVQDLTQAFTQAQTAMDQFEAGAGSIGGTGGGGGGSNQQTMQTWLQAIAASGQQITSQEAGAAGDILTGNNQLESIATWNAQVATQVAALAAQIGTTGKYIEQVGSYTDQFGNVIDFAQQVLNTNYTPAATAAAASTTDLGTSSTTAASSIGDLSSTTSTAVQSITQYIDGMNLVTSTSQLSATVAQQFTDSVNNGTDAVNVSIDSLGNWTSTLQSTGQQIQTVGPPTEQALENLGLSATSAKNLMALWASTGDAAVTAQGNLTNATTTATSATTSAASAASSLASAATSASAALQSVSQGAMIAAGQSISSSTPTSSGSTTVGPTGITGDTSAGGTTLQNVVPYQAGQPAPTTPLGWTYQLQQQIENGQLVPEWVLVQTPGASQVGGTFGASSNQGAEFGSITNPDTGLTTSIGEGQANFLTGPNGIESYGYGNYGNAPGTIDTSTALEGGTYGMTPAQAALQALAQGSLTLGNGLGATALGNSQPTTISNSGNTTQSFTINVNAATVVGNNGAQQLAQMIQTAITQTLRQNAGLKL
jgi:hypothetical protein